MYQCPKCKAMSLEPECEMCGPFEDKPLTKNELFNIYGFESLRDDENEQGDPADENLCGFCGRGADADHSGCLQILSTRR